MTDKFHALWRTIHTADMFGTPNQAFIHYILNRLPCGECRQHTKQWLAANPPVFGPGWFAYTVAWHNDVRRRQGKSELSVEEAAAIWRNTAPTIASPMA